MRGEDHVAEALQPGHERLVLGLGLRGEHVDRRAGDVAGDEVVVQRIEVDDRPAAQVEEERARAHLGELLGSEHAGVLRTAVDVQGHGLRLCQELLEGVDAAGVAEREPVHEVEEEHPHAQCLGHDRQLGADVAVPDDAQRPASHLVRPDGRLVPDACVHVAVAVREPAGHGDDLGDGELHHRARVGVGGVEHGDPVVGGGLQVDLVGADAEGTDGAQPGGGLEDPARDVRARPDAQVVDALEGGHEVALGERSGAAVDLVALGLEGLDGVGVDVLK